MAWAGYYDLDAGRPTRVEDGAPLDRYELTVQVMPTNVERMDGGTMRVRVQPELAFAPLPTEFELRAILQCWFSRMERIRGKRGAHELCTRRSLYPLQIG